jgi:hypothetical protein
VVPSARPSSPCSAAESRTCPPRRSSSSETALRRPLEGSAALFWLAGTPRVQRACPR